MKPREASRMSQPRSSNAAMHSLLPSSLGTMKGRATRHIRSFPHPRSTWNSKGPAHEHVASVQRDHEFAPSRSTGNGGGTGLSKPLRSVRRPAHPSSCSKWNGSAKVDERSSKPCARSSPRAVRREHLGEHANN
ncbi:hypothetical protein MXAN_7486 [Myxococcus xanthus DK 1622]|uniref:Uncharacterized protein n=1 Tax=Myxococcus xanthus (strain DK1622) TaxID=246197 RepID=Q1CVI4_MYXXD|nr:hypothetical protein MXAN_7486 [Myxococcus xanthus DK 1622]